jgi:hypothetical protein
VSLASAIDGMALSNLSSAPFEAATSAMGSPLFEVQDSGPVELLPNPNFVFPAPPDVSSQPSTLGAWNSLSRRPRSDQNLALSAANPTVRMRQSVSALPDFSFNPGSGQVSPSLSTPPHSPLFGGPSTPSRTSRHRRGGSELIGGDHRTGSVSLVRNSPVKTDEAPFHLAPPKARRHAHKRSGAMSCHDLQSILQPKDVNALPKGNSAPATPLEVDDKQFFSPRDSSARRSLSQTSLYSASGASSTTIDTIDVPPTPQRRPPSRARVGFSERVEYIRPLSTISSETESSMSTIRGHSVTGSMSSVMSTGAASPSSRLSRPALNTTFEDESMRVDQPDMPSEAAISNGAPNHQLLQIEVDAPARPRSADESSLGSPNSPTARPKRKSFTWWDSKRTQSPCPSSHADLSSNPSPPDSPSSVIELHDSEGEAAKPPGQKRPRKVKSWAHSFISRKPKAKKEDGRPSSSEGSHSEESMHPQNAALDDEAFDFEASNFEANFDEDNTVTIVNESTTRPPSLQVWSAATTPSETDALSPVIDLDAALGPFNTPTLPSNARSQSRLPPRARRSMHTPAFSAGAFAAGNLNHRRTESAPELLPFELRQPVVAAPAMPDVFEEEDEECEDESSRAPSTVPEVQEPVDEAAPEQVADLRPLSSTPEPRQSGSLRRKKMEGLAISTSGPAVNAYRQDMPPQKVSPVEVVEDYEEPRDRKVSDDTITPPGTADKDDEPTTIMRYSIPIPPHQLMTPDTLSGSSLSSPDFTASRPSFDAARLGTSTSSVSVNERRSFLFGEVGGDLRISVDDVPSLTSSRSTMTNPLHHAGVTPYSTERSASVYSSHSTNTAPDLRRKRGSIASLSRLVTASLEKSKLSIESRPMSQHAMPVTAKDHRRKSHRLSKLMQFWKSKEKKLALPS